MKTLQTIQLLTLPLVLSSVYVVSTLADATQDIQANTVTSVTPPSGGHVGGQPVGVYIGPGDTVPPCDGCTIPEEQCDMPMGTVCYGPACPYLDWTENEMVCKYTQYGYSQTPMWTQGYYLTIGEIVEGLQNGSSCIDQYGNITTRITSPFPVDEVHVFESGIINGYNPSPIEESVSATVCFDGAPAVAGWAFDEIAYDYDCELATVTISFNAACIQEALVAWHAYGTDMNMYQNVWLFYVDFVSCDPCEFDQPNIGVETWQKGVYKGPGDVVPLPE